MDKAIQIERFPRNIDLQGIFINTRFVSNGDFANQLDNLNKEQLLILQSIIEGEFCIESNTVFTGKLRRKINSLLGKKIFSPRFDTLGEIYKKMMGQIEDALSKFKPKSNEEVQFLQEFRDYVLKLDSTERTHNLNEWTLENLIETGDQQILPNENRGKIMISTNSSFDENLKFAKKHMTEAMRMYHERRQEMR